MSGEANAGAGRLRSTPAVKYVFLDVVRFPEKSTEAQGDIVAALNRIARAVVDDRLARIRHELLAHLDPALARFLGPSGDFLTLTAPQAREVLLDFFIDEIASILGASSPVIFLPTGDGLCIALLSPFFRYDEHLLVARELLQLIGEYNERTLHEQRRFQVRIGLNQNVDDIVIDINDRPNLAGDGVNLAQRVMSFADGGQILVSQAVYEVLQSREQYQGGFRAYQATAKHRRKLVVYQYIGADYPRLNIQPPSLFPPLTSSAPKRSRPSSRI